MKVITIILSVVCLTFYGAADDAFVSTIGKGVGTTAEEALKDITLRFRGSSNQRILDRADLARIIHGA